MDKDKIFGKFSGVFSRFPIAFMFLGLLVAFSAVALAINWKTGSWMDEYRTLSIIWYLADAAFLSVALALWKEEKPELGWPVRIAIQALLFLLCLYVTLNEKSTAFFHFSMVSISLAVAVCCLLASFQKEKDDVKAVNFTIRMVAVIIAGGIVTLIFMLALFLLDHAMVIFFQAKVTDYCYEMEVVLSWGLIFPTILFAFVPKGEKKHDETRDLGKFIPSVSHYLIFPVLCVYLLLLYAYAARILFTWTLPRGEVATIVSAALAGFLVLIFLIYPSKDSAFETKADRFTRKWLPILLLPPLILMSVGIIRRLSDYGITTERLYISMLNLWFYAVCIVLIVTRGRRIWWIPVTFAIIMVLSSVGPQSFGDITRRTFQKSVKEEFAAAGAENLPLGDAEYRAVLAEMDSTTAANVNSRLKYLYINYPDSSAIRSLVTYDVDLWAFDNNAVSGSEGEQLLPEDFSFSEPAAIPEGYSRILYETCGIEWPAGTERGDTVAVSFTVPDEGGRYEETAFDVPADVLFDASKPGAEPPLVENDGKALMIVSFTNYDASYIDLAGWLFLK
jgi:hypothetical protein